MRFPVCFVLYARIKAAFVLLNGYVYFLVLYLHFYGPHKNGRNPIYFRLYENSRSYHSVLVTDFAEKRTQWFSSLFLK